MAIDWIVPRGKTQADLDAEAAAAETSQAVDDARRYLEATDYQIIEAAEALLAAQGRLDAQLVADREAARATINDAETTR